MAITKISPSVVDFDAGITISTDDNSNNLTLTSTDADSNAGPILDFYRNSGSPAVGDLLGRINFRGRNDNSQDVNYAAWHGRIFDETDGTEDGSLRADIMYNGTVYDVFTLYGNEVVINESSNDIDFRVESNGNTAALFVDAGNDKVTTGVRFDFADLLIGTGAGKYIQVTGGSSNALAIGMDGGTAAPGTASTSMGFHHWNNSAWSNVMNVTRTGLAFGTDTAAANSLDDYEQGTWTPTLGGGSTTGSVAYSSQLGYYVKIGTLVYCYFDITISSASGMAGESILSLPITSRNANVYGAFVPWDCDSAFFDSGKGASGYVYPNTTYLKLYQTDGGDGHNIGSTWKVNQTGRISGSLTYLSG